MKNQTNEKIVNASSMYISEAQLRDLSAVALHYKKKKYIEHKLRDWSVLAMQ